MSEQPWRVGNHQPRNIYREGEYVAVVLGDDGLAAVRAREIVAVLNFAENTAAWWVDVPGSASGRPV